MGMCSIVELDAHLDAAGIVAQRGATFDSALEVTRQYSPLFLEGTPALMPPARLCCKGDFLFFSTSIVGLEGTPYLLL